MIINAEGAHIGDIVMLYPVLDHLEDPIVIVDEYIINNKDLFSNFKDYSFIARNKAKKEDVDIDLSTIAYYYDRYFKGYHRTDVYASRAGIKLRSNLPALKTTYLTDHKVLFIDQGSKDPKRRLSEHKLIELLQPLEEEYDIFLNGWFDYENAKTTNISDWSNKDKLTALFSSSFFIGPDSGWMHLAGANKISGIGIMGSFSKEERLKYYKTLEAYSRTIPCLNCHFQECSNNLK